FYCFLFFFQAEDGIRYFHVTGVQTCALPIYEKLREIARIQSHEIRRPLANILGIIDLLSKKSQVTQSEDLVDLLLKSSMELENRSEERRVGKECSYGW